MTFGLTVLKSNWSPPPHGVCVRFQVCVTTPLTHTHTHTLWCLYIGSVAVLPAAIWVTHHAWVDTKRHTLEDIQTYRTHIHTQRWVQWLSHQLVMSLRHQQVCVCVCASLSWGWVSFKGFCLSSTVQQRAPNIQPDTWSTEQQQVLQQRMWTPAEPWSHHAVSQEASSLWFCILLYTLYESSEVVHFQMPSCFVLLKHLISSDDSSSTGVKINK